MRFGFLSIFLIVILFCNTDAQTNGRIYADSILHELRLSPNDTAIAEMYQILASEYNDIDLDSALYYGTLSLQLSKKIKLRDFEYSSYLTLGLTHLIKVENDTALHYFNKALKGFEQEKDTLGIADAYTWLAEVWQQRHNASKALELQLKALELYENKNAADKIAKSYHSIGVIYNQVDEPEQAMNYYRKALSINVQANNRVEEGSILLSIADHYLNSGNLDSAFVYASKSYNIYDSVGNDFFRAYSADVIGEVYLERKVYDKAMDAFEQSAKVYEAANDQFAYASGLASVGLVYLEAAEDSGSSHVILKGRQMSRQDLYNAAIEIFETARTIFVSELDMENNIAHLYSYLSAAYEGVGRIDKALVFHKRYTALKDSIEAENHGKKIAQIDARRAMDLKNGELELQKILIEKKRNERGFLIGGIVLLLGVLGIIFYSYSERGKTNKLLTEEKQKSEALLLNILPEEVAEELKEKGFADATHFDEVTVLFTDFVNFSEASERMSSQELVNELHGCFKAFDGIMGKYGIEKIKTIGDAYLAVCGLPSTDKHHAEKVVSAAKDIRAFMLQRREQLGEKTFEIRIGVHSGEVVAGIVGVKKFAYDIWGDTVNTAARMEQNSQAGKINISQTTYDLVKNKFTCTYRGEIEAKGKGVLKMYFVEG